MERQTYLEGGEVDYFENRESQAAKEKQETYTVWCYSSGQIYVQNRRRGRNADAFYSSAVRRRFEATSPPGLSLPCLQALAPNFEECKRSAS